MKPTERTQKKTYALYIKQPDNSWHRAGTFRARGASVREISRQLKERQPNLDLAKCEIARASRGFESARTPCETES